MSNLKFRTAPRPDADVVDLLERILVAAQAGYVQSVAIVAVNPVHEVETAAAGDMETTRAISLIGGLSLAAKNILNMM